MVELKRKKRTPALLAHIKRLDGKKKLELEKTELSASAFKRLICHANGFENRLQIYDWIRNPLEEKQKRLRFVAGGAVTFRHWLALYYRAKEDSSFERQTLRQLRTLPAGEEEIIEALEFAPAKSKLRRLLSEKLEGLVGRVNIAVGPISAHFVSRLR